MSVRLILGRAGSGKTHHCLETIREEIQTNPKGPALILLVPEQASFQTDRALLEHGAIRGFFRAQVLSFKRLAFRVLMEAGGACHPTLSALGKLMLLRSILNRHSSDLRLFSKLANLPGFLNKLSSSLTELREYGVDRRQILDSFERLRQDGLENSTLASKLHDLAVILEVLESHIESRFTDPDQHLDLVAPRIAQSEMLRGSRVWIDGFSGFTPQEYRILSEIFRVAERADIALCLDPSEVLDVSFPDNHSGQIRLFQQTEETYLEILSLCGRLGVDFLPTLRLESPSDDGGSAPLRFLNNPELTHLERHLFSNKPSPYNATPSRIILSEASDPRQETNLAAREILRLCRENGYRFRDIAVIVRNLDEYHAIIEASFNVHGIPAFIDRRRPVTYHPLIELVRSAVKIVARNWPSEAVFHFLKTDLVTADLSVIPREWIDVLENYVLAHGIEKSRWTDEKPWNYRKRYTLDEDQAEMAESERIALEAVNRYRDVSVFALRHFHRSVMEASSNGLISVRKMTTFLFNLLDELRVPETLERWAREREESEGGDSTEDPREKAAEHRQVWRLVLTVLDEIVAALGETECAHEEYAEILEAGLASLDLGLTPPKIDQVLVGSVERSRQPDLRAIFVLGLTEGDFPMARKKEALFTEDDREELGKRGVRLTPGVKTQLLRERYLGYVAFTRARDLLWLSYPLASIDGKGKSPSPFIKQISKAFPNLEVSRPNRTLDDELNSATNALQLGEVLARRLRGKRGDDSNSLWANILDASLREDSLCPDLEYVLSSLTYRNEAQLDGQRVQDVLGNVLVSSVSRLESFAACPFQHLCRYLLRLLPRNQFTLEPADLGSFYHAALRLVFDEVKGTRLAVMQEPPLLALVENKVETLASQLSDEALLSSARNQHVVRAAERILKELMKAQHRAAQATEFVPYSTETIFGDSPETELRLPLMHGREIVLRGKIDRVDLARSGSRILARIIDYKMKGKRVDWGQIYHGLQLQLITYLIALQRSGDRILGTAALDVAGAFYVPIGRAFEIAQHPAEEKYSPDNDAYYKNYMARGLFSSDYVEVVEKDLKPGFGRFSSIYLTKEGALGRWAYTDPVPPLGMERILSHIERTLIRLAEEILDGRAEVRPYRMGVQRPCTWCDYRSVCRFDPNLQHYRELSPVGKVQLLEKLGVPS